MRSLLLAAAAALALASPAQAQLSFSPLVGYDLGYSAPTVGVAAEFGLTPAILPLGIGIRPSVEYIFLNSGTDLGDGADVFRVNGDLIGRFRAPGLPLSPYAKAGLGAEFVSSGGTNSQSTTNLGANLGVGAEVNRFLGEFTLGVGNISSSRIAVGYRF